MCIRDRYVSVLEQASPPNYYVWTGLYDSMEVQDQVRAQVDTYVEAAFADLVVFATTAMNDYFAGLRTDI